MKAVAKGIRRYGTGYQAYLRVRGVFVSKLYPAGTSIATMQAWREKERAVRKYGLATKDDERTLAQDAADYLSVIGHMPTVSDRTYRINQWVRELGERPRALITARDIRAVLERWRTSGSADGGPLSAGSLNLRRTALMHLWTVLDGKGAQNIVKDVPKYDERPVQPVRAPSHADLCAVLRQLRPTSRTRLRLRVLMWTGWPQKQISQLTPADLDLAHGRAHVSHRRKGKGKAGAWLPLLPRAVGALRRFAARGAFGKFSTSAMHSRLAWAVNRENAAREAAKQPTLPPIYPYMIRHWFGTWMAQRITDERALQELMLHATSAQTRRYTEAATAGRVEAAIRQAARPATLQLSPSVPQHEKAGTRQATPAHPNQTRGR